MRPSLTVGKLIDAVRQDIGYAIRGLRRSPGRTATIIVTFALGVGVNSAMFTVVDRVFFQAPPGVVDPGAVRRLVSHEHGYLGREYTSDSFSTTDEANFRAAVESAAEIEGYDTERNRAVGESKLLRTVGYATTGFFHLTGIRPYRGRFFAPDENRYGDPVNVAVLNYDFWRRSLSADSVILGRTIRIDTTLFTIIGITERGFEGMDLDVVDVWVPLASLPTTGEGPWWTGGFEIMHLFARVAQTADARTVEARLNTQFRADRAQNVLGDSTLRLEAAPLLQARSSLHLGPQNERNLSLMIRLAGVGLVVLVIAMSNVASLLLMRAMSRGREIAVRVALGISRRRLVGQLVIESVLLALMGGAVALLIALWTGGVLRAWLVSGIRWSSTVVDHRVVVFTAIAAVIAGVGAGLAPATIALRRDIMSTLKAGSAESGRPRSALRVVLLAGQTALCMVMLMSAGVFLQSVRRAGEIDLGFDRDRLITFELFRVANPRVAETVDRVRALPSVAAVSLADLGIRGGSGASIFLSNGDIIDAMVAPTHGRVDTAYAGVVGLRLLSGRVLSAADANGADPVVMINQATADAYWPNKSAIGDCFVVGRKGDPCRRIVGVVGNVRWDVADVAAKMYYLPKTPSDSGCCRTIIVRTRERATATTINAIRRIVSTVPGTHPEYPPRPRLVAELHEPIMRPWRIAAAMFLVFGMLALAAAGAGIYGLVGYDVTQRTHEFGVRITLGATSSSILRLVIGSGLRVVVFGLVAGAASALAAGRVIASLLFETSPYDPTVLVATTATLSVVALLASLIPAWRATRVDPVVALRAE